MMAGEPQTTAPYSHLLHTELRLLGTCLKKKNPDSKKAMTTLCIINHIAKSLKGKLAK